MLGRAGLHLARWGLAGPGRAGPGPGQAGPNRARPGRAGPSQAGLSWAGLVRAGAGPVRAADRAGPGQPNPACKVSDNFAQPFGPDANSPPISYSHLGPLLF